MECTRFARILFVLSVAATATSCSSGSGSVDRSGLAVTKVCSNDSECSGGAFCDQGRCAMSSPQLAFGMRCVPPPRTALGTVDAKLGTCGAYLCIDGRCRSCSSDAQCLGDSGAPLCQAIPDRPGRRCGGPAPGVPTGGPRRAGAELPAAVVAVTSSCPRSRCR